MKTEIGALIALLSSIVVPSGAHAQTLKCNVSSKHVCEPSSGCRTAKLGVFNLIDLTRQTFSRCDSIGCDSYDVVVSESGEILNLAVSDKGLLAKLNISSGAFTEVATLAGQVYVSFGNCK